MDIKWLEDLIALGQTGSLSRAATLRHVTQPAFGRRIRALENWAGVALVDHHAKPVQLTEAGRRLMAQSEESLRGLLDTRDELRHHLGERRRVLTLATGRTLARTWVADWLAQVRRHAHADLVRVRTGALSDTLQWLEQGQVDLLVAYHHPAITQRPQGRAFLQKTLAQDRLVPVMQRRLAMPPSSVDGKRTTAEPLACLNYAPSLALAGLVRDHLARCPTPTPLQPVLECDSADALLEYTLRGMGVCWLPWSLVAADCERGLLQTCWDSSMAIPFEVRLVRLRHRLSDTVEAVWRETRAS